MTTLHCMGSAFIVFREWLAEGRLYISFITTEQGKRLNFSVIEFSRASLIPVSEVIPVTFEPGGAWTA